MKKRFDIGKPELVAAVQSKLNTTRKSAVEIVETVTDVIFDVLAEGNKVKTSFGIFTPKTIAGRENFKCYLTGTTMNLPSRLSVKFKPSKKLLDAVRS